MLIVNKSKIEIPEGGKPTLPSYLKALHFVDNILALSDLAVFVSDIHGAISFCTGSLKAVLGIQAEEFKKEGWGLLVNKIHPADQKILEDTIFPLLQKKLSALPQKDRLNLKYSFTFRLLHRNGTYLYVSLENQPLVWNTTSLPEVYMSILRNITPYGNKEEMQFFIQEVDEQSNHKTVFSENYPRLIEGFSKRETEVIRLIVKGNTSKQIAETLNLSTETVKNHRKRILDKSQCASSAELVRWLLDKEI